MAEAQTLKIVPCPICNKKTTRRFVLNSPYCKRTEKYQIYRCGSCFHQFAEGRIDSDFLSTIYSHDFHSTDQQNADFLFEEERGEKRSLSPIIANALERANWLNSRGFSGKLLDVGAGRGFFLKVAKLFFDVSGVELSDSAAKFAQANGLRVFSGDFQRFQHDAEFDVITLWDVLASFPDPLPALTHVRRLLKPGGYCVLTLPMGDSRAAWVLGRFWPFWIPPVNLHYFSQKSLEYAVKRVGYDLELVEFYGKRVALSFIWLKLLRLFGLGNNAGLASLVKSKRPISLNFHDVATVVLKKNEAGE